MTQSSPRHASPRQAGPRRSSPRQAGPRQSSPGQSSPRQADAPWGRDAVMAAVVQATVELLAEVGPRDLSVRQVAERAGVNHALVHRHFGTKDEIVRQALEAQSTAIAEEIRARAEGGPLTVVQALEVLADHRAYWTTLARVALDDPALAGRGTAPTTELFAEAARARGGDAGTTAAAACLMLGWRVFGGFVADATGVTPSVLDDNVSALMRTLLRG